jgi:hypothetical protein
MQTSHVFYKTITAIPRYQLLDKCKPKYTIIIYANNDSALQRSTENGHLEIIRLLTNQGNNFDALNKTLQNSANKEDLNMVRYLISQGTNLNTLDNNTRFIIK